MWGEDSDRDGGEPLIIVPGPASTDLARKTASLGGFSLCELAFKYEPDGESYFRFLTDIRGKDVAVIQSTPPPQDRNLIQLILLCSGARQRGAKSVTAVVPYLAYARQDKMFMEGEVVSVSSVLQALEAAGVDHLITVNTHSPRALADAGISFSNESAIPLLCRGLAKHGLEKQVVVTVGKEGNRVADEACDILGAEYILARTSRDRLTGVVDVSLDSEDLGGRDVAVLDDIISTGGTVIKTVKQLREANVSKIYVGAVHLLLLENADEKLFLAGADLLLGTDTVPGKYSHVSVAEVLSRALSSK